MATSRYILCTFVLLVSHAIKGEAYTTATDYIDRAITTAPTASTLSPSGGGSSGGGSSGGYVGCGATSCPPCPEGYQMYYDNANPCSYQCLCQLSGPTNVSPGRSKNLLLSILQNIQNNADALEQMAKGLSDEVDLAHYVAELPLIQIK